MKKINVLWIMVDAIFLIVFNIIVFMLIREYSAVFWISYAFIHFSYLFMVVSSAFTSKTKNGLVFGYPIAYISSIYFFIELFVGIFFITIEKNNINATVIIQLIICGLYGITFILNLIVNEKTVEDEQQRQEHIMYVKMAIVLINNIMQQAQNAKVRKKVEEVYDAVKSSEVKTYPALARIERNIIEDIRRLEIAVVQNLEEEIYMLADQIIALIDERNRRIRLFH